ncbi:inverse autotransporter beta domain-containing protein, partial [Vibrio mediterranei]|uniref:inverse autotransporter beta domain-containing protein n=1 Tax=Vibrio mediterranei TaxID=689 RepID=UPI00148E2FCB
MSKREVLPEISSGQDVPPFIQLYYGQSAPSIHFMRDVLLVTPHLKLFLWEHKGIYRLMGDSQHHLTDLKLLRDNVAPGAFLWTWEDEAKPNEEIKKFVPLDDSISHGHIKKEHDKENEPSQIETKAAELLTQVGESEDREDTLKSALKSQAKAYAEGKVSSLVSDSLSPYGTVDVGIELGEDFRPKSSHLEFLVPFATHEHSTWFVQSGGVLNNKSQYEGRDFAHIGLGYRQIVRPDLMLGLNGFYDLDLTRGHQRGSVGAEEWIDNYKLTENYYFPLSGWKSSSKELPSKGLYDLEERPVSSVDIKGEGYLPSHPEWSADVRYEQKFGDLVATSDNGEPQSNPYIVSANVNYQPVPLVKFSMGDSFEKGVGNEAQIGLNFQYKFGQSLDKQLSPSRIALDKQFKSQMTTSLVQRNANIGLEYRAIAFVFQLKTQHITALPGQLLKMSDYVSVQGGKNVQSFSVKVSDNASVAAPSPLVHTSSQTKTNPQLSQLSYTVPLYNRQHHEQVINITAHLKTGEDVSAPPIRLTIGQPKSWGVVDISTYNSVSVTTGAIADKKATNTVTVKLKDTNNTPVLGETVTLSVSSSTATVSAITENGDGTYTAMVTDSKAETITVNAMHSGHVKTASMSFVAAPAAPVASGVSISGNAVVGQTLTGSYTYTDANGDVEDTSKTAFKWYRGTSTTPITGQTGETYTLVVADEGQTITFEVTPVAKTGTPAAGQPVKSDATAVIAPKLSLAAITAKTVQENTALPTISAPVVSGGPVGAVR